MSIDIIKLNKTLEDKVKLEEIGSKIIGEAIKNIAEEKLNIKPENPMSTVEIKKGDSVPEELKSIINTDANGKAEENWVKDWVDLIVWQKEWIKSKENNLDIINIHDSEREMIIDKNIFNNEEMNVLDKLNILDNINGRIR